MVLLVVVREVPFSRGGEGDGFIGEDREFVDGTVDGIVSGIGVSTSAMLRSLIDLGVNEERASARSGGLIVGQAVDSYS